MGPSEVAWRDTMRPVRFYMIDARLLALLTVWLFVPNWWTTAAVLSAIAAFRVAEVRGFRFRAGLRALRAASAGRRHALHAARLRRFVDFG
ncbi:MAG: IcmT/TraK family protein [Rhodospirillales bacterium]|nr:IcmT/TraK family protein [Rhodospirillales bacterium]